MKYLKYIALFLFLLPSMALAATSVPWSITNTSDTFIFPNLVNGSAKGILVSASSTINSTLSVGSLTSGNCVQAGNGGLLTTTAVPCGSGSGTVTQVNTTYPVLGGPFTNTGTISTALATTTLKQTYGTNQIGELTLATSTAAISNDWGITNSSGVFTFNIPTASATVRGLLSSTDFATFNGKQAAGNYITALTGDVTASGPGSAAATLASVISAGSCTNCNLTYDAKGRLTVAANGSGGGGGGSVSTSTIEAANQVATFSSTAGTPATVAGDSQFVWDLTNHRLGIGTSTPATVLDILGTEIRQSNTGTDSTNKAFKFSDRNYLNAQNNFLLMFGQSKVNGNTLIMGGGQAGYTAASSFAVFTGSGNNTDTGTSRFAIDATGNVTIASLGTGLVKSTSGVLANAAYTDFPTMAAGTFLANGTGGTAAPTAVATSSIFGIGTAGQIVAWNNGVPQYVATTTFSSPLLYSAGNVTCQVASGSLAGCLSSTDWNTFNGKQAAGNYITALTGDVTASGPGSVAATLATVNGNVGSFTNASITVNGKGLITAASSGSAGLTSYDAFTHAGGPAQSATTSVMGIGTTTPFSQLSVSTSSQSSGLTSLFAVASTTNDTLFNVLGNGNIGVGTSSPLFMLSVGNPATSNASAYFSGNVGVGTPPNTGKVLLSVSSTTFDGAAGAGTGIQSAVTYTGSTANSRIGALNFQASWKGTINNTATVQGGAAVGALGFTANTSIGLNAFLLSGMYARCDTTGSFASTTNCNGIFVGNGANTATALVSTSTSLYIQGGTQGGTVTNRNGIFIEPLIDGTVRYAINQQGPLDLNYFAGNTGIGTTSPYSQLSVSTTTANYTGQTLFDVANSSNSSLFKVLGNGNVGVGTTTPTSLFSVGTAANAFRVDSTGTVKEGIWNGTTITVANGGTGAVTLTGCLTGNGTGAITGSGTCNTSNATVSSVGISSGDSSITVGGTPVTTSGTLTVALALGHANTWTGQQIFNTANVGVSTSTPYAQLSVGGNAVGTTLLALDAKSGQTAPIADFKLASTTKIIFDSAGKVGISTTTPFSNLSVSNAAQQSGVLPLFTVASTTNSTLFTILGNGNVGIGTTTPGQIFGIGNTGNSTINLNTVATSTFGFGINFVGITGCAIAISNVCLSGGASGSGATGQVTYWSSSSAISGSNDHFWDSTNGRLGIGSSTPLANLTVQGKSNGVQSPFLFLVASSTPTATTSPLYVDGGTGHVGFKGTAAPAVSACGTGAVIDSTSNDSRGHITTGSLVSSCTITFKNPYKTVPYCICNDDNAFCGMNTPGNTVTAVSFQFTAATNREITYMCEE